MTLSENITGLQHIGIPCKDLSAACAFYQNLGFKEIHAREFTDESGAPGCAHFLQHGDLVLELYAAPAAGRSGAVDHIALNVRDIDAAYADICAQGLNNTADTIHTLPLFAHGVKYFTIEGPNKERVEFNQYLQA